MTPSEAKDLHDLIEENKRLQSSLLDVAEKSSQEIIRLKGLLKSLFATSRRNACISNNYIINKQWDFYKRENNL